MSGKYPHLHTGDTHMSAMKQQLLETTEAIDDVFGEGYAKKNPELVGRLVLAEQIGFSAYQIRCAIVGDDDEFPM